MSAVVASTASSTLRPTGLVSWSVSVYSDSAWFRFSASGA